MVINVLSRISSNRCEWATEPACVSSRSFFAAQRRQQAQLEAENAISIADACLGWLKVL